MNPLRGRAVLLLAVSCLACVSPAGVKQASTELTAVLASLSTAESIYRRELLQEIRQTRLDLEAAIVARAVKRRVEELSAEETQGNLISLSQQIEHAQQDTRELIQLMNDEIPAAARADPAANVDQLLERFTTGLGEGRVKAADDLDEQAAQLEAALGADAPVVQELRASAAEVRSEARRLAPDASLQLDLETLPRLLVMESEVAANLEDLRQSILALREVHGTVDEWIMTDVSVDGARVAELVERAHGALK